MLRTLRRLVLAGLALAVTAGVAWSFTDSFSQRWRTFVIQQFENQGVHLDFRRFGLSLIDGIVARDVRVFADASRTRVQLAMDSLNLDLDYGKLMGGKVSVDGFVEGVELNDATVTLPLDPDHPNAERLELKKLSARIYLRDDKLDIRRAEGDLAGIHVVITGSLRHVEKLGKDPDSATKDKPKQPGFAVTKELRGQVKNALQWLDRFTFKHRPELALDLSGNLDKPQEITASMRLTARDVGYETYICKELTALADYHDRLLDVRRVSLRDHMGTFEASGTWPVDGEAVRFSVTSTADLPQLARSFFDNDELREVVLYESSPPSLSLEGTWYVQGAKARPKRPVEALGRLKFGQFNSRGEIFDGMSASFGVSPDGYYIRDALLRHRSGTLSLQAMSHDGEGFRYRAVMRMDPSAFLHFAGPNTARLIKRFEFGEHSSIFVEMEGTGPDADLEACRNQGRMELRQFKYRGVDFLSWTGDLEIVEKKEIFRQVSISQTGGQASAAEICVDDPADIVTLTGVKAKMDPVPLTSCFARPTAEALAKYRFGAKTEIELNGVIDYGDDPKRDVTDFTIKMKAPGGTATYPLWERNYVISDPDGTFSIKGSRLTYDLHGQLFDRRMSAKGHVELGRDSDDWDVKLSADEFRHIVVGKDLPFRSISAEVVSHGNSAPFDISGTVLGGKMSLKGALKYEGKKESYRGELRLDAVNLKQFSDAYGWDSDSEGDVTGHLEFTGIPDNWKALQGSGVLIILNGDLYALPVLGPLTPLLGALLPGPIKGYNIAREASCNFTVADGFVVTKDFEALTSVFKLVMHGNIDFINDNIDLSAQARAKGLPGLVLRPVSELFAFKGDGPVGKPSWRPHLFGLTDGKTGNERKAPTDAELQQAERAGRTEQQAPEKKSTGRFLNPFQRLIR